MLHGLHKAKVENDQDPKNEQRVQVRVLGIHNFDEAEVSKDSLPWALPVLSPNSGKVDGGYGEFDVPCVGDWVWVFFEDEYKFNPHYLGVIRTEKDKNSKYIQTQNKYIHDRWDNEVLIDAQKIQITKNNGHVIEMHDDYILLKTVGKNQIKIDDTSDTITVKTVDNNYIQIDPIDIQVYNSTGSCIKLEGENIILQSLGGVDIGVKGNALIAWLASHTHIGNLGVATSVPVQAGSLQTIVKDTIQYQEFVDMSELVGGLTEDQMTPEEKAINYPDTNVSTKSLPQSVINGQQELPKNQTPTSPVNLDPNTYSLLFRKAIVTILKHEGGYVNNPNDPGGETNYGIAKKYHPEQDIKAMTPEIASTIYYNDYWQMIRGDDIGYTQGDKATNTYLDPFALLALQVFDFAVNAGVGTSAKRLKLALGFTESYQLKSKVDDLVINKLKELTPAQAQLVVEEFKKQRIEYYNLISAKNPKLKEFLPNWITRTNNTIFFV